MAARTVTFSALELCGRGEYLAAAEALGIKVSERPENVSGGKYAQAEALLVAGIILSNLGGIQQVGDPALAANMILESIALYGDVPEATTARAWLTWAYDWAGEPEKALALIDDLLPCQLDDAVRFRTLILKVVILTRGGAPEKALNLLKEMELLYEPQDSLLKGKFHCQRGRALRLVGEIDRGIIEYVAAIEFFRQSGQIRWEAMALNNLAGLYLDSERFAEGHDHAEQARAVFRELGDRTYEAKSWDQTALIYLAEGKLKEAEQAIIHALSIVEQGAVLTECQNTYEKIKHKCGSAHRNCGSIGAPLPYPCANEEYPMMSHVDQAACLIENDKAAVLYDFLIWATSDRDNPQHEAELDGIEQMICSKLPEFEEFRAEYKRRRLTSLVP